MKITVVALMTLLMIGCGKKDENENLYKNASGYPNWKLEKITFGPTPLPSTLALTTQSQRVVDQFSKSSDLIWRFDSNESKIYFLVKNKVSVEKIKENLVKIGPDLKNTGMSSETIVKKATAPNNIIANSIIYFDKIENKVIKNVRCLFGSLFLKNFFQFEFPSARTEPQKLDTENAEILPDLNLPIINLVIEENTPSKLRLKLVFDKDELNQIKEADRNPSWFLFYNNVYATLEFSDYGPLGK